MPDQSLVRKQIKTKLTRIYGDNLNASFPIPIRENERLLERFLLMRVTFSTQRSRPFGMLTVEAEHGTFLLLQDCRYRDFVDTKQFPFSVKLDYSIPKDYTTKAYTEAYHQVLERYDQLLGFVFADALTKEQAEIVQEYNTLLQSLVPKALMPFYQAAGPEFFSWIAKNI